MDQSNAVSHDLKKRWADFRQQNPNVRIRDAAAQLGVSEAQLLATSCGETVTRLAATDWGELLKQLETLGKVMALTRNDAAVHEKIGIYQNVQIFGAMGQVLDEGIDLRLFLSHWRYGFAVSEETGEGMRRSLQFFAGDGTAVHKIYLKADSIPEAFSVVVGRYRSVDQTPSQTTEPPAAMTQEERPDSEIDVDDFRARWKTLHDTHEFHALLRTFGVTRTQALRLAGRELAQRVGVSSLQSVLESAAGGEMPIMVFVGNVGVIQIHTGPIFNVKRAGNWLNVLDPGFNLHVREDEIDSAWIVRKMTNDGFVTSLELYDAAGKNIALLFGKRKPEQTESDVWRRTLESLPLVE